MHVWLTAVMGWMAAAVGSMAVIDEFQPTDQATDPARPLILSHPS